MLFPKQALERRLAELEDREAIRASATTGLDVAFKKVKGHSGIPLNEKADQLATTAKNGDNIRRGVMFAETA